jgi:polysaccharide pyruvyl transferase WcaK-like protein
MSRPASSVALYGLLGCGNIGNDASFETVLEWLRSEHREVEVRCVTRAPQEIQSRYTVPSVPLSVEPRPGRGRLPSIVAKVVCRLADIPRSLAVAGSADAIVIPGMGVLEESLGVRPWAVPAWMFLTAAACRLRRRPFVLLAVGAEPIISPFTRRLFVATVGLATHVSYRDEFSAESMRRAGARRPPDAVTADLAFAHPAGTAPDPEPGHIVVGVMAYYGFDDDHVRGAGIRQRYVDSMTEVIVHLAEQGDRVVLLGGDRADVDVARQIQSAVRQARPGLPGSAVTVRDVRTFAELTSEMARAEVVVASRFHNLISALRLARPVVSVGYAEKSARLMDSLGLGAYHQGIEDLDAQKLLAQLMAARAQAPALAQQIGEVCRGYDSDIRAVLGAVAGDVLQLAHNHGPLV